MKSPTSFIIGILLFLAVSSDSALARQETAPAPTIISNKKTFFTVQVSTLLKKSDSAKKNTAPSAPLKKETSPAVSFVSVNDNETASEPVKKIFAYQKPNGILPLTMRNLGDNLFLHP